MRRYCEILGIGRTIACFQEEEKVRREYKMKEVKEKSKAEKAEEKHAPRKIERGS